MTTEEFVFAYGSLVAPETLPPDHHFVAKSSCLWSYKRVLGFPFFKNGMQFLAFNIFRTNNPRDRVNGVTYVTNSNGIDYLLHREAGYDQITVWPRDQHNDEIKCKAFGWRHESQGLIAMSYALTAYMGFRTQLGKNAAIEFVRTTAFENHMMVDDIDDPVYERMPRSATMYYGEFKEAVRNKNVSILTKSYARDLCKEKNLFDA